MYHTTAIATLFSEYSKFATGRFDDIDSTVNINSADKAVPVQPCLTLLKKYLVRIFLHCTGSHKRDWFLL